MPIHFSFTSLRSLRRRSKGKPTSKESGSGLEDGISKQAPVPAPSSEPTPPTAQKPEHKLDSTADLKPSDGPDVRPPATVMHTEINERSTGLSNQGIGRQRLQVDYENYTKATYVYESMGNNNVGDMKRGGTVTQGAEGPLPQGFPTAYPAVQIPLDAYGRAHNVVCRMVGNANFALIPEQANLEQNFKFHSTTVQNQESHQDAETRRMEELQMLR